MTKERWRSCILAAIALAIGGAELVLDNGLLPLIHGGPVAGLVEIVEILIMVPGLAIGVFFASEWVAVRQRSMLRRIRDAREERFALLGRLAASVAHEVRNPLQSLRLVHEALAERCTGEDATLLRRMDANLADIDGAITRIYELVRPVLHDDTLREEVDCRALLAELVEDARRDHPAVVVTWRPEEPIPLPVLSVRSGLRIAFGNLLRNAVEAAVESGAANGITIDLRREPGGLEVTIANRGALPAAVVDQTGPVTSRKRQGLGLGLMISEQVVGRLGGTLQLDQRGDEVVAAVRLPYDAEAEGDEA